MTRTSWTSGVLIAAVTWAGCGSDDEVIIPPAIDSGVSSGSGAGSSVGGGGTGAGDPGPMLEVEPVYGVTNVDDDDEDGTRDWNQGYLSEDDDLSPVVFNDELLASLTPGTEIRLTVAGATDLIRVYHDGSAVMGVGIASTYSFGFDGAPNLEVEFGDFLVEASMLVEILDDEGAVTFSQEIPVVASPLILNHHLQPAERAWVLATNANASMRGDFTDVLGARFEEVPGSSYGFDVWLQDEPQFATQTGNHGERQDVIIDSIRDRGLDDWPEDVAGREFGVDTWGSSSSATTFDSFGNLEVSPPVTVGGVDYPFGRIYYGREGNVGLGDPLADFLASQRIQAPVELDTSWLCVGHIDEYSTFIPDPSSPKGFKLLFADTRSAYALLETLNPNQSLQRYGNAHGVSNVGQLLNDGGIEALNDEIQQDELDPALQRFKDEFGLTDDDIILIPSLFEECGPYAVALVPGMVNLIVANPEGETPTLLVPDPFFRGAGQGPASDPFAQAFLDAMPEGLDVVFTDNWFTYHVNLGEVHCGTAMQRSPDPKPWWIDGQPLLELGGGYFQ